MGVKVKSRLTGRPLSLWLLLAGYLLAALFGFIRLLASIINWYWLTFANIAPGPLYLAVTGAVIGLVSLVVLAWIWLGRPGYRLMGTAGALFFALLYWFDRLVVMNSVDRLYNAVFAAGVTVLSLVYITIVLRPWPDLKAVTGRIHRESH